MGIKINESYTTSFGIVIPSVIATIKGELNLNKRDGQHEVEYIVWYYVDETQYAASNAIHTEMFRFTLTATDITTNLPLMVYNHLKAKYTNTTDI
jgi:hypothetical protein